VNQRSECAQGSFSSSHCSPFCFFLISCSVVRSLSLAIPRFRSIVLVPRTNATNSERWLLAWVGAFAFPDLAMAFGDHIWSLSLFSFFFVFLALLKARVSIQLVLLNWYYCCYLVCNG
jgi:hypothetical protein